jgi:hypothetical protein
MRRGARLAGVAETDRSRVNDSPTSGLDRADVDRPDLVRSGNDLLTATAADLGTDLDPIALVGANVIERDLGVVRRDPGAIIPPPPDPIDHALAVREDVVICRLAAERVDHAGQRRESIADRTAGRVRGLAEVHDRAVGRAHAPARQLGVVEPLVAGEAGVTMGDSVGLIDLTRGRWLGHRDQPGLAGDRADEAIVRLRVGLGRFDERIVGTESRLGCIPANHRET